MADKINISLVIPIYNVAPYIAECIQSVKNQTWKGRLECILVDDCGTDDSMAVVEKELQGYEGKVNFLIIHHDKNRGLSAARNTGLAACTGDYVYFLDSDDEITPDCIELLAKPLDGNEFDLVVGDYRIVGSDISKPPLLLPDGDCIYGKAVLHSYRRGEWYMLSVNKLYRIGFLKANLLRFYEGIIHEDELWSFQVACLAQSLCAVGHETYIYKVRAGSITVNKDHNYRCRCINIIMREMHEFVKAHNLQGNINVFNIQQNFRMIMMYSVQSEAPSYLPDLYKKLRQDKIVSWKDCFLHDGLDIRKQLRDFHFLLPINLAVPSLRLLFYFI